MIFPYARIPAKHDAAFPERRELKRPVFILHLAFGDRSMTAFALLDSGADHCIFPASIARELGILIPNERAAVFSGTSEKSQIAYFETVQASIWNGDPDSRAITFDLYAGFCESFEHVGYGILGQQGFFSNFEVTFDYPLGVFYVS